MGEGKIVKISRFGKPARKGSELPCEVRRGQDRQRMIHWRERSVLPDIAMLLKR
jgi:hypothetical protein